MVPITPTQRILGPFALYHQSALLPLHGPVIERTLQSSCPSQGSGDVISITIVFSYLPTIPQIGLGLAIWERERAGRSSGQGVCREETAWQQRKKRGQQDTEKRI